MSSSQPAAPGGQTDTPVEPPLIPGQPGAAQVEPIEPAEPVEPVGSAEPVESAEPAEPVEARLDDVSAAAVELARSGAVEVAGASLVGGHLGVVAEPGGLAVHSFACLDTGYRGWAWAVSLARPLNQAEPTICEVVLLPRDGAVLAPAWVPWSDRLAPGDLGPGDELPYRADDPNLVPGYTVTDDSDGSVLDAEDQQLFWELGLGRERVLGPEGVRAAAERWRDGAGGPEAEVAIHASAACVSCGYYVPVSGLLRQEFGVCANDWSPSDGRVVSATHGCGAHSQTEAQPGAPEPLPPVILDETLVEPVDLSAIGTMGAVEVTVPVPDEPLPGLPEPTVPEEPGPPDPSPGPVLPEPAPEPGLPVPDPEPVLPEPDPEPVLPGLPEPGIAEREQPGS